VGCPPVELPTTMPDRTSPLESAIAAEAYDRYRAALQNLQLKDRELIVARVEVQWSAARLRRSSACAPWTPPAWPSSAAALW
jgi:hypothetical protein